MRLLNLGGSRRQSSGPLAVALAGLAMNLIVITTARAVENSKETPRPGENQRYDAGEPAATAAEGESGLWLGRHVLAPLLNAGHLNRMYYAPPTKDTTQTTVARGEPLDLKRHRWHRPLDLYRAAELNLKSLNNRGPAGLAALHFAQKPAPLYGQRRHDAPEKPAPSNGTESAEGSAELQVQGAPQRVRRHRSGHKSQSQLPPSPSEFQRRSAASSPAWSQPDPRRSYSAPVSLVKVVHASRRNSASTRRLYGIDSTGAGGRQRRPAALVPQLRRKEDQQQQQQQQWTGGGDGGGSTPPTELTFTAEPPPRSPGTLAPSVSTSTMTTAGGSEFDTELLDGAGDSTQSLQPPAPSVQEISNDISASPEIERKPEVVARHPLAAAAAAMPHEQQMGFASTATTTTTAKASAANQPLVTLIRYVPIIMNVPAEQLGAALAGGAPKQQLLANNRPMRPVFTGSGADSQHQETGNGGNKMILTSSSDSHYHHHHHHLDAEGQPEFAQLSNFPLGLSASQIQQVLSEPHGASSIPHLAHLGQPQTLGAAGQPVYARLAYIPLSGVGAHGPLLGASGAGAGAPTSKAALAAYASKLISMLKPSALFSSLGSAGPFLQGGNFYGGGGAGGHGHPQQQPSTQQIFLLAPAPETLLSAGGHSGGHAHQQSLAPPRQITGAPVARPEDLLLNQASKVHSTKSQKQQQQQQQQQQRQRQREPPVGGQQQQQPPQQQQQQQVRWPLMPQMNGLICVQGLIGSRQQQQQQRATQKPEVAQEQLDMGSFDDETAAAPPVPSQKNLKGGAKAPTKKGAGPGKGPKATGAKESPIRMMQKMVASKASADQEPTGGFQRARNSYKEQDFSQMTQQKLLGSPSESRNIFDNERAEGQARAGPSARSQPPPLPPPVPVATFAPGDEVQTTSDGRRSIIPFTIRDKIEAPGRGQAAPGLGVSSASNGPVQYDEPAETSDQQQQQQQSPSEPRRSRTTFVSSSPLAISGRESGGPRPGGRGGGGAAPADISYSYNADKLAPGGYSLPVLMASSTPRRREPQDTVGEPSRAVAGSQTRPHRFPPGPPPPLPVHAQADEPLGAGSSASSISTSTATTSAPLESGGTDPPATPPPPPPRQHQNRADSPMGQLISEISMQMTGSASARSTSQTGAPPTTTTATTTTTTSTARPNGGQVEDTVELLVHSTPARSEAPITASPLHVFQLTTSSSSSGNIPAGAVDARAPTLAPNSITSTPDEDSPATTTTAPLNQQQQQTEDSLQMMSSDAFSHDRSLAPPHLGLGAHHFARISESLQTNPLDLIDLQNSRTSFELPAQLESLSMLESRSAADSGGGSHKFSRATSSDKQQQPSREQRGPLNTAAFT